jgi:SagB-type dehydrogenase family enzyme
MDLGKSIDQALMFHQQSNVSHEDFAHPKTTVPEYWTIPNKKTYERLPKIELGPGIQVSMALPDALSYRASDRRFANHRGLFEHLETICFHSLKQKRPEGQGIRPYPSAGDRYPCEVYFSTRNMQGLQDGLYHYDATDHSLTALLEGDFIPILSSHTAVEDAGEPNILVIVTAVLPRTMAKYGGRGYRYALIEAGALMQNIALVGLSIGYGSFLVGGFFDQSISEYIDIAWELELEAPLSLMLMGQPINIRNKTMA